MSIILIAPPAAGKGTISNYMEKKYGFVHIATGDLLRLEVANNSSLGRKINHTISNGYLVDDKIVTELVLNKIKEIHNKPFILDGFPRTLNQAKELDKFLEELHLNKITTIYLEIDINTVLKRIEGRRICNQCQKVYNIYSEELKPIHDGLCDNCAGILNKRSDDDIKKIKIRFKIFEDNIKAILDFYKSKRMLKIIPATIGIENIVEKIINEAKND